MHQKRIDQIFAWLQVIIIAALTLICRPEKNDPPEIKASYALVSVALGRENSIQNLIIAFLATVGLIPIAVAVGYCRDSVLEILI